MAGRRGRGADDLLSDSGNERAKGLRPGLLQMLFKGGSVDKAQGHHDLRHPRNEHIRPGTQKMLYGGGSVPKPSWQPGLFRGGSPHRMHAVDDLRYGRHEDIDPAMDKMLFKGGSPDRQHAIDDTRMGHDGENSDLPHNFEPLADGGETFSAEEKLAAHEVMGAMKSGDPMKFLSAMKGLFMLMDSDGGDDGSMDGQG